MPLFIQRLSCRDVLRCFVSMGLILAVAFAVAVAPIQAQEKKNTDSPLQKGVAPPELEGGVAWLNTGKPITLKELKGKIVILDFWTFCCINCIHIMPDLARLEKKYPNQLVVIGIHSGKFANEKNNESIRKAILRYELKHPIVNDAEMKIWNAYKANWWPTVLLLDPDGKLVAGMAGEDEFKKSFQSLDKTIDALILKHRKNKTLDETPIRFDTAKFRDQPDTPLYFPGKVVADAAGKRLMIADSTHHRIVITDMDGKKIAIAGTGQPGNKDGPFDKAQFDDPQGMAVIGDVVYVADRKNHKIRRLDLKSQTVWTVAGNGRQARGNGGDALANALNSPWDVWFDGKERLFIAMSGNHQIWTYNFRTKVTAPFAGDQTENILDGPRMKAKFAQPSGLTSDGTNLYIADCEVSAVRKLPIDGKGPVATLVGRGLFDFGDRDGPGQIADEAERKDKEGFLQHAVGVAYHDGFVYVADTYNSKIKTIDLKTGMVATFLGGIPKEGEERIFNEPAGLSVAGDTLYVADTNSHRIRVVNLKTKEVKTLKLTDVPPVEEAKPKG